MEKTKCLEYYFDSRIYSSEELQQSIDETKKQFPSKKVKVRIALNDFGVYIITFRFENKNNFFRNIKIKLMGRFKKQLLLSERTYGQYKPTKTYKPY